MNTYGHRAMEHWKRWHPKRYAALPDPQAFFDDLGQQASAQVIAVSEQLEEQHATDLAVLGYVEKVGRLNAIRMQAEEIVLAEMVLLEPEPGTDEDSDDEEDQGDPLDQWIDPLGMPWDRDHDLWRMRDDESVSTDDFLVAAKAWERGLQDQASQDQNR